MLGSALNLIKLAVALLATGLLLWGAVLVRVGRPEAQRKLRDAVLLALAVVGGLSWWNLLQFETRYIHTPDVYHYYVGSKYFQELSYTRLYECTAVADWAVGADAQVAGRRIRNLRTNLIETTDTVLAEPDRCIGHFSPGRWREFLHDVTWFRERLPQAWWQQAQIDHGYNATPTWGILGTTLANLAPASDASLLMLTLIDPLLLIGMWSAVWWAFGWRSMCIALIFFGTNQLSGFEWIGGAFLRQDWLAATIVGICLLRRDRPIAGGFLLTYATLLRVFPGTVLLAIGIKALFHASRQRRLRLSASHGKIALGCLLALLVILPLTFVTAGGVQPWLEFVENSETHLKTPTLNYVGLKAVLWYESDTRYARLWDPQLDDTAAWKEFRTATLERRYGWFVLLALSSLALLAFAAAREEDWHAAVVGIGAIPVLFLLTGYYYAILLGFALLYRRQPLVSAALCALSVVTGIIPRVWGMIDDVHTWSSVAILMFVIGVTLLLLGSRPAARESGIVAKRVG